MSYKRRRRNKRLSPKTKKSIRISFAVVMLLLFSFGIKKITEPRYDPMSVQLTSLEDLEKIHKGVIRKVSKEHEFETQFKRLEGNDDFMDLIEERNYKFDLDGNASLSSSIHNIEEETIKTSSYFFKDGKMKYASGTNDIDEVSSAVTGDVTDPKIIEPFVNGHRINQEINAWDRFVNGILKESNLGEGNYVQKKDPDFVYDVLSFEKFEPSNKALKEMYPEVKEFDWLEIIRKEGSPEITISLYFKDKDGVQIKEERTFFWDLDGEAIDFPTHSMSEDVEDVKEDDSSDAES